MRGWAIQRISVKIVVPRNSAFSAPMFQRSRKTSSSGLRFTSHSTNSPSVRGSPGRRSSESAMRASKSQPISMMRFRAFSIALRPASK